MKLVKYKRSITSTTFITLFILCTISLLISQKSFIHSGGYNAFKEIIIAMFKPDLSKSILKLAFHASLQTISYAFIGIILAFIIGFSLSIIASGIFTENKIKMNFAKILLNTMRGIHEIIWALFFVAAIGMTPFAAIFAIMIPYSGALGKIFTEIFKDTSKEPILNLKLNGASKFQIFIYGYLPQCKNQIFSYFLYRFECAIRSSTILSFIGIGGIGFQINLSMKDLKYNEAWSFIYILIFIVILIDIFSNYVRKEKNTRNNNIIFLIIIISTILNIYYLTIVEKISILSVFNENNLKFSIIFLKKLLGIGESSAPYTSLIEWKKVFVLAVETLQMSIIAVGIASTLALFSIPFTNKHFLKSNPNFIKHTLFYFLKILYVFTRTVPELIWAVILVFIFKPGIFPGALALAIHNYGILGKLSSEVIDDYDYKASMALKINGASTIQTLSYSTIPTIYSRIVSYILYRFEVIVRSSVVVGFIGAGGLGESFRLNMSYFHYSKVFMILIAYLIIVFGVDYTSSKIQHYISART